VLVILEARDGALHLRLVILLVHMNSLEVVKLISEAISLLRYGTHVTIGFFKLSGDVVDVPLERHDLLHEVLFLFLGFRDLERSSAYVFVHALELTVKVFVLLTDLVDC